VHHEEIVISIPIEEKHEETFEDHHEEVVVT
jgi:hypothetical protein